MSRVRSGPGPVPVRDRVCGKPGVPCKQICQTVKTTWAWMYFCKIFDWMIDYGYPIIYPRQNKGLRRDYSMNHQSYCPFITSYLSHDFISNLRGKLNVPKLSRKPFLRHDLCLDGPLMRLKYRSFKQRQL